ncbi:prepilin-type N-terminal cleavage/methylation domain-containing protein [Clostridium sp. DJ247]|uniref:prepilin-type N-terminal cleavage/methylation domain-containing protein n=1 Tax=Clostridium sp. DJ247 TaxID=2726188 RepID=UPI0016263506|nr:prepilin-type N-terminal cleavage/methylation domain-containing protein [Clostridium sp. DJ247]MBC2579944.1 prepilin-type N-terminal cleavage/methylation domain-containing protein [Clostridium sp. DJ247]
MKKKKGFTLIELMIVLAIIAILAVVLIPKSTIFKNTSKNTGVITNVNTVKAYLETKTADSTGSNSYLDTDKVRDALDNALNLSHTAVSGVGYTLSPTSSATADEKVINPIKKGNAAVYIVDKDGNSMGTDTNITTDGGSDSTKVGQVVVVVYNDGYALYGVDNVGTVTQIYRIK